MQPVQMRGHQYFALKFVRYWGALCLELAGNPLFNPLMGSFLIVVGSKFAHDPAKLLLAEDEKMVTALTFQRAHKPLLDGIGSRSLERGS